MDVTGNIARELHEQRFRFHATHYRSQVSWVRQFCERDRKLVPDPREDLFLVSNPKPKFHIIAYRFRCPSGSEALWTWHVAALFSR